MKNILSKNESEAEKKLIKTKQIRSIEVEKSCFIIFQAPEQETHEKTQEVNTTQENLEIFGKNNTGSYVSPTIDSDQFNITHKESIVPGTGDGETLSGSSRPHDSYSKDEIRDVDRIITDNAKNFM